MVGMGEVGMALCILEQLSKMMLALATPALDDLGFF